MDQVASLRATNCSTLLPLGQSIVAACGPKSAYLIDTNGEGRELGSCSAPRAALGYTLWLPPGVAAEEAAAGAVVLYSARHPTDADKYAVLLQRSSDRGVATVSLDLADAPPGPLEALQMVSPTVLCLQTARTAAFFVLDPAVLLPAADGASVAVPRMGVCELPDSEGAASPLFVLAPPPAADGAGAGAGIEAVVVRAVGRRVHARLVRLAAAGASATVEGRTAPEGLALPSASPFTADDLVAARVWWRARELVLAFRGAERATVLVGLPFGDGAALSAWNRRPNGEPEFVTAATRTMLWSAADLCCDANGTVWALDASAGPSVVLRNVTSSFAPEVAVPGSSSAAKVSVAVDAGAVYVLAGRGVYALATATGDAATTGRRSARKTPAKAAASPSKSGHTMSAWLLSQQRAAGEAAAEKEGEEEGGAAAALATALLRGGPAPSTAAVVRDVPFVHQSAGRHSHAVLDAVAAQAGAGADAGRAVLRYVAVAQSVHPYTVLAAIGCAARPDTAAGADDALVVALAAYLSTKPALQPRGGFRGMASQAAATADYFARVLGSGLAQKRFTAAVCRAALSALAGGALDAAALLFDIADVAVAVVYGRHHPREVALSAPSAEERRLEADMAEGVSVMRSFADWALGSAAASIGMMSAHVGEPSGNRKEAALRDGKSHPIRTSRAVDIEALSLRPRATTNVPIK